MSRRSFCVAALLGILLGIAAKVWLDRSPLRAQQAHQLTRAGATHRNVQGPLPPRPNQVPLNVARAMAFPEMDVVVNSPTVGISGRAQIQDNTASAKYVWLVRVYKLGGCDKVLFREHHYVDQAFEVPEGQAAPTFTDATELPSGHGILPRRSA